MNLDTEENTTEYIVTALQIFDYCGVDSSSSINVDTLMDKFAPFIKTNKTEYSYLRRLLDPEQNNPKITAAQLATTLSEFSENQKSKIDLDESFNLRGGQVPLDSDSGISTDGFQILEELQCELREKTRLALQLRAQLDSADRHHEEALAAVTAERDSLRTQLNMLREEHASLSHAQHDYEEASERLSNSERAFADARRDLAAARRRAASLADQLKRLEAEKSTLQEQLSNSKGECHRINELYASRQAALREENEALRTERADLAARVHDQDAFLQELVKDKVLLEMELKDMLNKSNQTQLRLDRSIDVSYSDDHVLTALDSLHADSKFAPDNQLLDEESFINALKEDQGRPTNMSLFDEIRLSFYNKSRHNISELNCTEFLEKRCENYETPSITLATQTDNEDASKILDSDMCIKCNEHIKADDKVLLDNCSQTDRGHLFINIKDETPCQRDDKFSMEASTHIDIQNGESVKGAETTAKDIEVINMGSQTDETGLDEIYSTQLGKEITLFDDTVNISTKALEIEPYVLRNKVVKVNAETNTNTDVFDVFKDIEVMNIGTQTFGSEFEVFNNNSAIQNCVQCKKCTQCDRKRKHIKKLERDLKVSRGIVSEMQREIDLYQGNLNRLTKTLKQGDTANDYLSATVSELKSKLDILEACSVQRTVKYFKSAEVQTGTDQSSASTQVSLPCSDCVKRRGPQRRLRKYLWEPLKSLFQLFALVCFACAVCALYGVTRRWPACREPLPWRWLRARDIMDLFLSVEYVAEVPM